MHTFAEKVTNQKIFSTKDAFELFNYQYDENKVYQIFCDCLGKSPKTIKTLSDIPLIPIDIFKDSSYFGTKSIEKCETFFQSSGTASIKRSKHYIFDLSIYENSLYKGMSQFYNLEDYALLCYTPAYENNPNSSLIYMLKYLSEKINPHLSCFLDTKKKCIPSSILEQIKQENKKVMLFGAAFGLVDMVENNPIKLPDNSIIIETGGMKTFRKAMSRAEIQQSLASGFGIDIKNIHSEYGMSELLSQAYSYGHNRFKAVPWMHISIRNPKNPFEVVNNGEKGQIGIIDLANVYSGAFLLTGDQGIKYDDDSFEVLGRMPNTALRGCNFLMENE